MPRFLCCALLLLPISSAEAQEKTPDRVQEPVPPLPDLDGSTEQATLTLNPPGHAGAIKDLFFTRDGKQLISVGADKTLQFWDVGSGDRVKVLRLPAVPTAAALSPDGKTLAVGRSVEKGHRTYLVNLEDGRILWLAPEDRDRNGIPVALAISPDGDRLAAALQGGGTYVCTVWDGLKAIWDSKPEEARRLKGRRYSPNGSREMLFVRCLAFSPDGQRLVLGLQAHGEQNLHNAQLLEAPAAGPTPGKLTPLNVHFRKNIMAVAWSPDGQQVVTVDQSFSPNAAVTFWSAADGKELRRFKLGARDGSGLHFLNDRELLLTWLHDGSDKKAGPRGFGQSILGLGEPIAERKGPFLPDVLDVMESCRSALSADGKLAAFTGGLFGDEIALWETGTGKKLNHLGSQLAPVSSVGWSKDGNSLGFGAFADKDRAPFFQYALDLKELQMRQKVPGSDYLRQLRASGDWSVQPHSKDWGKDTGFVILRHGDQEVKVKSPDRFWRASTLAPGKEPTWLAWATHDWPGGPGRLHLADLRTGTKVRTLSPGRQRVTDLAPSPDGRFLLTAARDNQVSFLYRIADDPANTDPQPLLNLFVAHGDWILWTREGYYAASPNGEKLMGWTVSNGPDRLPTFHPAERFRRQLYRPELIKLVLEKGSVAEALKASRDTRAVQFDNLLPPRVVLTVVDQSKLPTLKLKVQAEASSQEQPILSLRLMVDGRVVPGKGALVEFARGQAKAEVQWTFTLPEGEHQLAVLARGPDSSAVSPSVRLKHVDPQKLPTLHVLTVGINQYRDRSLDLDYAAADAQALAAAFARHCKGEAFGEVNYKTVLNAQATTPEVLKELTALRKQVSPPDLVVVFFGCHGVKHKKDYYLLTHEADTDRLAETALSGDALGKALSGFKCQVLLMLDACHSAGFGEGKKLARLGLRAAVDDVVRDLTDDEHGVAVMCAAMGHEKAEESRGHGLFTRAVLDALEKKPGVPYNHRNQRMYVHHLHSFVFDEVSGRSEERQHPFLSLPWVVESFVIR